MGMVPSETIAARRPATTIHQSCSRRLYSSAPCDVRLDDPGAVERGEARDDIETWRIGGNRVKPHSSLDDLTPGAPRDRGSVGALASL